MIDNIAKHETPGWVAIEMYFEQQLLVIVSKDDENTSERSGTFARVECSGAGQGTKGQIVSGGVGLN